MKNTKGPWEADKEVGGVTYIKGNGQSLATMNCLLDGRNNAQKIIEEEANANLIASAPEMKKALYDIIDFASDSMPNYSLLNHDSPSYNPSAAKQYDLMKKIVDIANRAIIKAEGSE